MFENIITLLFPLILSLSLGWVIELIPGIKKLKKTERLLLTLAASVSFYIISLSWYGTLSGKNLRIFTQSIFTFGTISLLISLRTWIKHGIKLKPKKSPLLEKLSFTIIFILLAKAIIMYFLHPTVDPDLIYTYLPFARSITTSNTVPVKDYYTLNPMTIPPIGGPILFTSSYILSNNIYSENFKLLTLPFFLGFILLTYLFARKVTTHQNSLFTAIIFLSLPIIDQLLISWSLYPDIIFSFLGLLVFYFTLHILPQPKSKPVSIYIYLILAFSLASALLLKSQGIFLIYSILIIIIPKLSPRKQFLRILTITLILISIFTSHKGVAGITSFGIPPLSFLTLSIYGIILIFLNYRATASTRNLLKIKLIPTTLLFMLSGLGLIWFNRNLQLYSNISVPLGTDYGKFYQLRNSIYTTMSGQRQKFAELALLLFPTFGTFFIIPKITGMINMFYKKKLKILGFWLLYWYTISIVYFGYINERYIFIIVPILSLLILQGLMYISKRLVKKTNLRSTFIFITVSLFSISSLFQSEFISWNFGPTFSYSTTTSSLPKSSTQLIQDSSQKINTQLISSPNPIYKNKKLKKALQQFTQLLRFTNNQLEISKNHKLLNLLLMGTLASLVVIWISKTLSLHLSRSGLIKLTRLISFLLIAPYIFIIWRISEGKVSNFPTLEKEKIYHNHGEVTHITPYLVQNAPPDSKVLIFGPQTGTAYQTGFPTWNIERGYGLKEFTSIVNLSSSEIIDIFNLNNINYAVFSIEPTSQAHLDKLNTNTNLVKIIKESQSFVKVVDANQGNKWELYERKD